MCHKSLNKLPAVLAITVSCMGLATSSKSSAQGLFKRLQDRVQTLEQSRSPDPSQTQPDANPPRSEPRRPLLDKLLQNGSELFSGVDGERQASPFSPGTESWVRPPGNVLSTPGDMGNGLASLGIEVVESARGVPGVLVAGFSPDSRADDAGLRKNDVIVSLDQTLTTNCRRGKLSVSASSGANCFGSSFTWRPIDCFADSTLWSLGCGSSADAPGNLTSPLEC